MRIISLVSLLLFLCGNQVFAQVQVQVPFEVSVKNKATGKSEAGASVKVTSGGSTVQTVTIDGSGKTTLSIPGGKKYKIEFSKPGKITRYVELDLTKVVDELLQGNSAPKGKVDMTLFDEVPNFDFSYVSTNPATVFYYEPEESPNLVPDLVLANRMIDKVEKLLKDAEKLKGQSDAAFNAAVKKADDFYKVKKYNEALTAYGDALKLKQTDPHANQRYLEVEAILKAEKASAQQNADAAGEYKALIDAADQLYSQKKYEEAILRYKEALIKKPEVYAQDQITKAEAEIARLKKEAENAGKYAAAITAGDNFMKQGSFQAAKDQYREALKLKAGDPVATAKIDEIDGKLNSQKADQEKQKQFTAANDAGDALYAQEKWEEAKAEYNKALAIQPSSAYTLGRIKEIDGKLEAAAKEKAKQEQITKLLAEGDTEFKGSKWASSKAKYQEVLKLDAANAVATGRIGEIETKLNAEKADAEKLAKIKQLITEGDALAKQAKLEEAKAKYTEADGLKADEAVKAKIAAIDAQLLAAGQKAEQKAKYDKAMQDGEALFAAANYEGAKAKFGEAQALDAAQALPKQRIIDADKKIAELAASSKKEEQYAAAFAAGTAALSATQLTEAQTKFKEAIAIDGTKAEAKAKLQEVEALLAADIKAKENAVKYETAVKAGNDLLTANKLKEAKTKFQEAAALDASQALPGQKIAEIDALLGAADQKKQVDALLAEGNTALGKKDLPDARTKFEQVLKLESGNAVAAAKLQEITGMEAELAGAAQKEATFKQLKADGVALMDQGKYPEAKQKLNEAKAVKEDPSIDPLIRQIDDKIALQAKAADAEKRYTDAFNAGSAALAGKQLIEAQTKFKEAIAADGTKAEAKAKLQEVEALLANEAKGKENVAKYEAAVKAGTDFFAANKLPEAKAKFQEAQALDQSQALPQQKIREIDALLASVENQKQVETLLAAGNAAFGKNNLEGAKTKFNGVLAIDATNAAATAKLQEIAALEGKQAGEAEKEARFKALKEQGTALMASASYAEAKAKFLEAKAVKADPSIDPLIKSADDKIAELSRTADAQAKKEADYAAFMKKGNEAFESKNYLDAIQFYNQALAVKPAEKEPADRAAEAERLEKEKGNDFLVQYQKVLAVAQKAMDEKNYTKAKEMYDRALTLKADDPLPRQKLLEIEALLKVEQQNQDKMAAYNKKVTEAEGAAKANNPEGAIALFEAAKLLKPDETLPDNRIAQLRAQIEGANAANAEVNAKYEAFMSEGNAAAVTKDYQAALGKYQDALGVKKGDKAAAAKVSEMKQLLDDLAKSNEKKAGVDKLITAADAKFGKSEWMDAKAIYEEVIALDPSNTYAKNQSALCDKKSQDESTDQENKAYNKIIAAADNSFDSKDYNKAKDYYKRANKNRPSDAYPKRRLKEIDNILNPKPVPPVVVSKDPQKLPDLGNPDNSLSTEALTEAEKERKKRRFQRHNRALEAPADQLDSLSTAQYAQAKATDSLLTEMVTQTERQNAVSNDKQRDNSELIINSQQEIDAGNDVSDQYESAENLGNQSQLTAASIEIEQNNGLMDGKWMENSEALKADNVIRYEGNNEIERQNYLNHVENKDQINRNEIKIAEDAANDDSSRREMQVYIETGSSQAIQGDKAASENKAVQQEANVRLVEEFNKDREAQNFEDNQQPEITGEILKGYEKEMSDATTQDNEQQLELALDTRKQIEIMEADVAATNLQNDDDRLSNVEQIKEARFVQEEIDRNEYNALMVRNITSDQALSENRIEQDRIAAANSAVPETNNEIIRQMEVEGNDLKAQSDQNLVNQAYSNQASMDNTRNQIDAQNTLAGGAAAKNSEALRINQATINGINDTDQKLQESKALANSRELTDPDKKELDFSEGMTNDVGKLYPEGVSQEQFENKDSEGLLVNVVTRRVVVKNGFGNVYVRTQTLDSITYSKDGQAVTEYVWQNETQNANLKRNY